MPVSFGRPASDSSAVPLATDAELATHAADTTSVHGITDTSDLLTATMAADTYATITAARTDASVVTPGIVSFITGQVDETLSVTNCTAAADTVNYKLGDQGWKLTMSGAVTATAYLDPPGPSDPMVVPPCGCMGLWVYLSDATKVTSVSLELWTDAAVSTKWSRTASSGLVTGWNLLRWATVDGKVDLSDMGYVYRVRVVVVTNAATDLTIGHAFGEASDKARVLIISDSAYKSFETVALPDLRALGIPVTWALDPTLLGSSAGTAAERMTESDVAAAAAAGDSVSFHGWDGSVTSAMTTTQIAQDTLKCIRWLQQRGYSGRLWRAAWVQNAATNAAAAQPYVVAYATPSSGASTTAWPPVDRWNIPRIGLAGRSTSTVDGYFTSLAATLGLLVIYVHGIDASGGTYTTQAEWDYFVGKLTAAVDAGWLEGVTFEQLYASSGGKYKSGLGTAHYDYLDETGSAVLTPML